MRILLCTVHNLKKRTNLFLKAIKYPNIIKSRYKSNTMKFLNIAEKNDAAKNIALHLSRGTSRRREGLSQYNKIYEFDAEVMGQKTQMVMTSVSGHLLALEFVGSFKHWQSCSPLSLFDAPVFKYCPENYEKIKNTLEREIKGCQGLIIWTDCDREGENIGFEIIEVCSAVKNNLRIFRAKFSEITAMSVRRALHNLEQPNKNISDAVDVRQELDLRIGAAFTRFQTLRLQKVFPSKLADSLVSYGSCQFPTLGFVVERYRAVENFVAEPFWKIKVNHTKNNLSVDFNWDRVRLFDEEACQVLHDICLDDPQAKVAEVKTKPKSKWRPLPLDTVELEKLASRKLKINAKETMRLAEKLYTNGLISYPRTETNEYPKEMNLGQLVGLQTTDPRWGPFAQGIIDSGGPNPRQGNKSDKAHPPIHPTKYTNSLSGNEQKVYEFIVRSFLACCSKDAEGQETTVTIHVANEKFSANGLMITARNYLDVYPYDKWSSKEIHVYQNGETFNPSSIDMVGGSTSPPNLLTEADLIALMEKHGIGTDATHAEHIETIKNRSYVALNDTHFVPGLLGMGLVEGYDAMGLAISKPHLRAQLEADLKAISEGRKQPQLVLAEQVAAYKEVYLTVTAEANKVDTALAERFSERPQEYTPVNGSFPTQVTPAIKCPKCGTDMVVRNKKSNTDEFYIGCMSFPNCKNAVWLPSVVKSLEVLSETCSVCGPNYKKIKFEWRNNSLSHLYPPPYTACIGGCDSSFLEIMRINLSSVRSVSESRTQNTNSSNTNSNTRSEFRTQNSAVSYTNSSSRPQIQNVANRAPIIPQNHTNESSDTDSRNPFTTARQLNQGPTNERNSNASAVNRTTNNTNRMPAPRGPSDGNDSNVLCGCNQQAILLTVRKQTANFGKKFFKCAKGKENGGCDFFLWAPENMQPSDNIPTNTESNNWPPRQQNDSSTSNSWGSSNQNNTGNTTRGWGITPARDSYPSNDDDVKCDCHVPCKRITVQKEGPNKGRPFYCCPKEYSARCNFFQWADSAPSTGEWGGGGGDGGGGPSTSSSRGRGRGSDNSGSRVRKCAICRQPGHTRNKCPNNAEN